MTDTKKQAEVPQFEISKDGLSKLIEFVKTLANPFEYIIQIVSKDKARSSRQQNWYFGMLMPAIRYFLTEEWDNIKDDNMMHKQIEYTLSEIYYEDKIYSVKDKNGREMKYTKLSIAFNNMSHKKFQDYLNKILINLSRFTNFEVGSLEELIKEYCVQTGEEYKPYKG